MIAAARPYIKTEIYKHLSNAERDAYDRDLRRLGYRLFKCEGEVEYRGEELRPGELRALEALRCVRRTEENGARCEDVSEDAAVLAPA